MKIYTFLIAIFFNVSILSAQVVGLPTFADICENEGSFTLNTGTPSGGVYSGVGVIGNSFNPSAAGSGTYTITYTYIDATGTYDTTQSITVNAAPVVSMSSFPTVCESDILVSLSQGSPTGGTYSGSGIYFNSLFFIDSTGGVGSYPIQYKYIDFNTGCSDSVSANLVVNPSPNVNLVSFSGICEDQSSFTMIGGTPSGGVYVLNNSDTVSTFDPAIFGADSHLVNYYFADPLGCVGVDTATLVINAVPAKPSVFPFTSDTLLCTVVGDDYEWFKNDSVVGLNSRKLAVNGQNGVFKVRVTKTGCISDVSDPYTYGEPFSVDESEFSMEASIFPNPNNGEFQITLNTQKRINYKVYNVVGSIVKKGIFVGTTKLNLQEIGKGLYFLELQNEEAFSSYPIMVQ